jgi:putative FmdB family regulatory protein
MPTYEFRCPEGHEFEKFYRSIAAAPREVHCPTCGKIAERQLSGGAGLVFKGSGFYITDYGKDGKKPRTPPAAEGAGGADTAAKPESAPKPEAKATDAKAGAEVTPATKSGDKPASPRKSKSE